MHAERRFHCLWMIFLFYARQIYLTLSLIVCFPQYLRDKPHEATIRIRVIGGTVHYLCPIYASCGMVAHALHAGWGMIVSTIHNILCSLSLRYLCIYLNISLRYTLTLLLSSFYLITGLFDHTFVHLNYRKSYHQHTTNTPHTLAQMVLTQTCILPCV